MHLADFADAFPGELVQIEEGDHAFLPEPLPPIWEFPADLWPLLAEAKQQIGILEGLGRNLPNPTILLRPLEDREALRSSELEGTYATPQELLLFELEPRDATSEEDPANDWQEVFNYRKALHAGTQGSWPLSLALLRELHKLLLTGVRGRDRDPGQFRSRQVYLGYDNRFIPPPPYRVTECLEALEPFLRESPATYDAIVHCFLVHYQFETIHPFLDGNGRVGRLLLTVMLQRFCCLTKPWLYMSAYYDNNREEYFQRLFRVSSHGEWAAWIEFCLRGVAHQANDAVKRCEKLLDIRNGYLTKLESVGGNVRLNQIIEQIFNSPFIRVADLARRLDVSYPTAKSDIDRLVQAEILKPLEGVTPNTFCAPAVFDVSYGESADSE